MSDPHPGLTSSGLGTPATLGTCGCAAGGLLAGAESACVRLHQGPRSAPLQVRDPHPDRWLWLGEGTGTPGRGWELSGLFGSREGRRLCGAGRMGYSEDMKPLEASLLQVVPGIPCLFLLCGWALGSWRAHGKRWHRAAGGLVAADQAVPPGQPSRGRCHCHRLPLPPPSAAGGSPSTPPGMEPGPQELLCLSPCLL